MASSEEIQFKYFNYKVRVGSFQDDENQLEAVHLQDDGNQVGGGITLEKLEKDVIEKVNGLTTKKKVYTKYLALNKEEKSMYYENIYFYVKGKENLYEYAIELDQDFHNPKWNSNNQSHSYLPIYEILRESAYFEFAKKKTRVILLRFGYKDSNDKAKIKKMLTYKLQIFTQSLEEPQSELHKFFRKQSIKKGPLVVFVDYDNENNEQIKIHKRMDSKPMKKKMILKETKFRFLVFSYDRSKAEKAAKLEQESVLEGFEQELAENLKRIQENFNKLKITNPKRKEFEDLIEEFKDSYKEIIDKSESEDEDGSESGDDVESGYESDK